MKSDHCPENPITSLTLNDLLKMAGSPSTPGRMNDCIVMSECIIATTDARIQEFHFPYRIDAYIIGVGTEGETTQMFNLKEYRLRKDSLFIFPPKNILHPNSDKDSFKAHLIIITPSLLQQINIDTKRLTPLLLHFASHPCLELTPEESRMLRGFIAMIESELRLPETEFTGGIIGGMISALIYKVGAVLGHYLTKYPESEKPVLNRSEEYFRRFTALLSEYYTRERSVGFYARELCITPKYLTTMIRHVSGKSASEWIDTFVIMEAKTLLKYSHMSIQEVAYALNFPNQSFFGSYFRRITGMSPSQYKAAP